MFQIELIIRILSTLCIIVIPLFWVGYRLFVVSAKIDDTIQQEIDKISLIEQQKYDLIHDKYIQQLQEQQFQPSESKFEIIDDINTHIDDDVVSQGVEGKADTGVADSSTTGGDNANPTGGSTNHVPSSNNHIFDQSQITISGKTLDDQLRDKKSKIIYQIKQEYKVLVDKSDLDAIERKLIEGIALDPDDKDFNSRLADLYFWTGNHKKALTLLRKNLDIIPDDHKTLWQISEIHIKQGDYDQAQIIIAQAIVKESNNPKYYMTQAEALYKTKDIQGAIYAVEQAIRLRPNNQEYLFSLGEMYQIIGENEKAKNIYYRLFELDPLNIDIKDKIAQCSR